METGAADARTAPPRLDRWILAGILGLAVNLRIAVVAVGPIIETIRSDLDMSSTLAGLLVTIPFFCMGLFALLAPHLLRRHGAGRVALACLVLIAVTSALRGIVPTGALLLAVTIPLGVGVAVAGAVLPSVVKRAFPAAPGRITGAYVALMSVGAAVVAYTIVPLSHALGGWRPALALTAVPAAIAIPLWIRRLPGVSERAPQTPRLGRPSSLDLRLGLIFGGASLGFTGTVAWVAAVYQDAGWSATAAGAVTGAILLISIPAALTLPGLSDGRNRRVWTSASALMAAAAILGFALAPTTLPWLWIGGFAIANGVLFPLVLTLPLDAGPTSESTATGVAWAMGIGFMLGSLAPVLIGAMRDLSGGFEIPMSILAGVVAGGGLLAVTLRR